MTVLGGPRHLYAQSWGRPDVLRVEVLEPLFGRTIPVPAISYVHAPGPPRIEWIEGEEHACPELDGCLLSFARLAKSPSNERLADFAMRWGPLGICEHGWPSTHLADGGSSCVPLDARDRYWEHHTEQSVWSADFWSGPDEVPLSEWRGTYWEPLVAWRFFVRQFAAALNIAYSLQEGRSGRREDWAEVLSVQDGTNMDKEFAKPEWKPSAAGIENGRQLTASAVDFQHEWLTNLVTHWMLVAGVTPWVSSEKGRGKFGLALGRPMVPPGDPYSRYEWHRASLYGILTTQLAMVVSGGGKLMLCDWCKRPYAPDRTPSRNRRHFCSPECKKDAHREGDAKYQRKKRRARTPTDTPTPTNHNERT